MPTTEPREQHRDMEQHKRETLNALVGQQVIHSLGKPNGLHRVQVRRLWDDHYRVNVLIGEDPASAKIANSYFVEADGNGNIVESTPKITKQY
jgi:hypothetical protein